MNAPRADPGTDRAARLRVQVTSFALAQASTRESQDACDAQQWQNTVVAALADGVGEARHGGLAARRTVVNTIAHLKSRPRHWSIAKALEEFARSINRTLYQWSTPNPAKSSPPQS
jgi:serine/threonine protein phosphatase PrpC